MDFEPLTDGAEQFAEGRCAQQALERWADRGAGGVPLTQRATSTEETDGFRSRGSRLSQIAGESITENLAELTGDAAVDRDVREQAVFALSQRPRSEGVPALINIARTNRDPEIRKKALFWLGQSRDPRALALFEEILSRR